MLTSDEPDELWHDRKTVMSVKEHVSVMKSSLECKWQKSIRDTDNVVIWLVE